MMPSSGHLQTPLCLRSWRILWQPGQKMTRTMASSCCLRASLEHVPEVSIQPHSCVLQSMGGRCSERRMHWKNILGCKA